MTESERVRPRTVLLIKIADKDVGQRLDKFLTERVPDLGRRGIRRLFAAGKVSIYGHLARKSALLTQGTEIQVELESDGILPEPELTLSVLLETESLVALNKPAGQATLPRQAGDTGTLANGLVARFPECGLVGGRWDAGLVHRLDHFTSGVLVAARSEASWHVLREIVAQGRLVKRYTAIVTGVLTESGVVERAILPSPRSARRVKLANRAASAEVRKTAFKVLGVRASHTLIELEVSRAYRHQIRVHLASIGHAIVGDRVYGAGPVGALGERHALHASYAAFAGDTRCEAFEVSAPLPAELAAFWDSLGA